MKYSLQLFRIAGIDVKVHWTFAILLLWLAISGLTAGKSIQQTMAGMAFVLSIFICVLLHEFGHALAARRYGIRTPDITLLPIGGMARLERIPEEPRQEFFIAIAGPLVNVVIAIGLYAGLLLFGGASSLEIDLTGTSSIVASLLLINVSLVLFNMIPAFPMDGGRVLRALLATRMNHVKATEIAASVGQLLAMGFGILGLFTNGFLVFIALFVFLGAQAEAQSVVMRSMLVRAKVRDAMLTRFEVVSPDSRLQKVIDLLLAGDQRDFPVVDGQRVCGLLHRQQLIRAISEGNREAAVDSVMQANCPAVSSNDDLQGAFEFMQAKNCSALPVMDNGLLAGLLTQDNIAEWLMIQTALREAA